jgi:hypothetical protein
MPLHMGEQDVRAEVKRLTEGRGGVDVTIDAVGHPDAFDTAIRITRACGTVQCVGIYAEHATVHLGLAWLKSLTIRGGQANVIAHIDPVLAMLSSGELDPGTTMHGASVPLPELRQVMASRNGLWFEILERGLEEIVPRNGRDKIPYAWQLDALMNGLIIQAITTEAEISFNDIEDVVVGAALEHARAVSNGKIGASKSRPGSRSRART